MLKVAKLSILELYCLRWNILCKLVQSMITWHERTNLDMYNKNVMFVYEPALPGYNLNKHYIVFLCSKCENIVYCDKTRLNI